MKFKPMEEQTLRVTTNRGWLPFSKCKIQIRHPYVCSAIVCIHLKLCKSSALFLVFALSDKVNRAKL